MNSVIRKLTVAASIWMAAATVACNRQPHVQPGKYRVRATAHLCMIEPPEQNRLVVNYTDEASPPHHKGDVEIFERNGSIAQMLVYFDGKTGTVDGKPPNADLLGMIRGYQNVCRQTQEISRNLRNAPQGNPNPAKLEPRIR